MAKIQFNLASQGLVQSGPVQVQARGEQGAGNVQAPTLRAPQAEVNTLPANFRSVPVLDPQTFEQGSNLLLHSAFNYSERQDALNAEDALLRAREKARGLFRKTDNRQEGPPGFEQLQGKEAVDSSRQYQDWLTAAYDEPAANLNPNARAKYLAAAAAHKMADLDRLARHTVKQQDEYAGQVRYAAQDAFYKDFELNPVQAMEGGGFDRLLALQPDLEKVNKTINGVFSFAADKFIAEDYRGGHKNAAAFLQRYGGMASPDARLAVEEKIASAMKAAEVINKRDFEDNLYRRQMDFSQQAPGLVAKALMNHDGAAITKTMRFGSEFIKPKSNLEYEQHFGDIVTNALQTAFNGGRDPALIKEDYNATRSNAEKAGEPIPVSVDVRAFDKLDKLEEQRRGLRLRAEQDGLRYLAANAKQDPITGFAIYDVDNLPQGVQIDPGERNKILQMQFKNREEGADKVTDAQREAQFNYWYALATSGQLKTGNALERKFLMTPSDPETRMKFEQFRAIQSIYADKDKNPVDADPRHKAAYDLITTLRDTGKLSLGKSDKEKKKYQPSQLDFESYQAEGEWKRRIDVWMKENPGKDVMPELQKWLTESAVMTGFWGSTPNYPMPKEKAPEKAVGSAKSYGSFAQ